MPQPAPPGGVMAGDFVGQILDRLGIPRSFLAHLRELRSRLLRVLFTVGFFYILFFMFEFREVARLGGLPVVAPAFSPFHPFSAQLLTRMRSDLIPPDVQVIQVSPTEIVILYMQIALVMAIACAMPMALYQFGRFVMPALYRHERRELVRLIAPGVLLFALGCAFAYRIVVPPILNFLFEYSRELSSQSPGVILVSVSLGQALEFAMMLVLAFGFVFEMPLVMSALTRIGIVEARTWRRFSRHAAVGFLLAGGFITPDTSGVTQVLVALPMMGLYFSGCVLAEFAGRRAAARATTAPS
jgi:sec-independent protein translocase protein TatC